MERSYMTKSIYDPEKKRAISKTVAVNSKVSRKQAEEIIREWEEDQRQRIQEYYEKNGRYSSYNRPSVPPPSQKNMNIPQDSNSSFTTPKMEANLPQVGTITEGKSPNTDGANQPPQNNQVVSMAQQNETKKEFDRHYPQQILEKYGMDQIDLQDSFESIENEINKNMGASVAILGSSKSGKTTLLKQLFENLTDSIDFYTIGILGSPQNEIYKDIKFDTVQDTLNPKLIQFIKDVQKENGNKFKFLIIIDDQVDLKNNNIVRQLFTTLRNSGVSVVICLQQLHLLSKTNRGNTNFVYSLKFNDDELIDEFKRKFISKLDEDDYRSLVNDHKGTIFLDQVDAKKYYIKF